MIAVNYNGQWLMDREALAQWTNRSEGTIRARCAPVRYWKGRPIYDAHASAALLDDVPTRRRAA